MAIVIPMRALKIVIRTLSLLALVIGGLFLYWSAASSDALAVTNYEYRTDKLPSSFSYKIVQLADWHNHALDYSNAGLLAAIRREAPDAIVSTGDMVDDHTSASDFAHFDELLSSFGSTPLYFVNGNHEESAPARIRDKATSLLLSHGAISLNTARSDLGNGLVFSGIEDPGAAQEFGIRFGEYEGSVAQQLNALGAVEASKVNLILAHRPRYAAWAEKKGYDLQLSGHAHGGQIVVNGIAVMNDPLNPYVAGRYDVKSLALYVSKGLGVSYNLPFRYRCDAELLTLTIRGTAG